MNLEKHNKVHAVKPGGDPAPKYTYAGLYQLFMVCVFPIHIWAIIMAFRDFSWVAERTRTWDAIGLIAYALIYALMETIGVFLLLFLLGLFTPKRWEVDRRVGFLGSLFLVTSFWAILGQLYSFWGESPPKPLVDFLVQTGHPIRITWGIMLPMIILSAVLPAVAITNLDPARDAMVGVFERISLLSAFYVFLDAASIVIVLIRGMSA